MSFDAKLYGKTLERFAGGEMIFFNGFWADVPDNQIDQGWLPYICKVSDDLVLMEM